MPLRRLLFLFVIIFISIYGICTLYYFNLALFLLGCLLSFLVLIYKPYRFKWLAFFTGFLAFVPLYGLYKIFFTPCWIYANPTPYLGFPAWDPLFFILGFIIFGELAFLISQEINKTIPQKRIKLFKNAGILIILIYCAFAFSKITITVTSVLILLLAIFLPFAYRLFNLTYFYVSAILGIILELLIIHAGAWQYPPSYFQAIGLPVSIPLFYGLLAHWLWLLTMLLSGEKKNTVGFE